MSGIGWRLDAGAKIQQGRCMHVGMCNINWANGEAELYAAALGLFIANKVTFRRINLLLAVVLYALKDLKIFVNVNDQQSLLACLASRVIDVVSYRWVN
jgi:hypothetical protein